MSFLRFLMLLSLVAWIGGLIFFAFVLAPTAFQVLPTTHLAVIEDGMVVSYCEVYRIDDIAQIESVATVPDHRRRGHARAVVTRALELTAEYRLVFLCMDPADWPQHLYAQLGMDDIGRVARFRKALPGPA